MKLNSAIERVFNFLQFSTPLTQFCSKMPVICVEIEELVISACRDLQTQEIPNIRATARKHGALSGRVYRRLNYITESLINARGANKVLDNTAK
jgi:hypothetical protein